LTIRRAEPGELGELQRLRAEIYLAEGFLTEQDMTHGLDIDEDDSRSVHLAVHQGVDGPVVGTTRLIFREGRPLPIERRVGVFVDSVNPFELSRFAVESAHRSANVSIALWKAMYDIAISEGVDDAFAIVERPLLTLIKRFGFPFEEVGEPFEAYHSLNWPVRCPIASVLDSLRRTRPSLVDFFDQHVGPQVLGDVAVLLGDSDSRRAIPTMASPVAESA
jgi:N-acyl-L-homoserine lactone synthetase